MFDVKNERVRAALADAPKIGDSLCDECAEHFGRVRGHLDAYGVAVHRRADARARPRLLHAHRLRVHRPGRERAARRSAAAAATTASSRRSAARRRRASASAPGSSGSCSSLELEGVTAEAPLLDVFFAVEPGHSGDRRYVARAARRGFRRRHRLRRPLAQGPARDGQKQRTRGCDRLRRGLTTAPPAVSSTSTVDGDRRT